MVSEPRRIQLIKDVTNRINMAPSCHRKKFNGYQVMIDRYSALTCTTVIDKASPELSRKPKKATAVRPSRIQMASMNSLIGRCVNSPAKYADAVAADTTEVAMASKSVTAAPKIPNALPPNCKRYV